MAYINGKSYEMTDPLLRQYQPQLFDFLNKASKYDYNINDSNEILGSASDPFVVPFNKTIDVFINNTDSGSHAFHLHGHTFWIIDTSNEQDAALRYKNRYARRNIVTISPQGWARIRFISDNPGVWLFHCHSKLLHIIFLLTKLTLNALVFIS